MILLPLFTTNKVLISYSEMILVSLYLWIPVLNPFITLLILKPYRNVLLKKIQKILQKNKIQSTTNAINSIKI